MEKPNLFEYTQQGIVQFIFIWCIGLAWFTIPLIGWFIGIVWIAYGGIMFEDRAKIRYNEDMKKYEEYIKSLK